MAYSEKEKTKLINDICNRISKGEALRNICSEENYPVITSFYKWIDKDEEKAKQYVRACRGRADSIFEDILDIADDSSNDIVISKQGEEMLNTEFVQRSRLRVDSRKWMLGKLNPKKYGDKLDLTSGGEPITQSAITIINQGKEIDLGS